MKMENKNLNLILIFTFVTISLTRPVSGGCGVNFDKMKKRRIEAIRGQILSKLGMTELPNNGDPPPAPRALEEMYNRTRDFILENARQKRRECEETDDDHYYAQEIVTVNAKRPTADDDNFGPASIRRYKAKKVKREQSEFFSFDVQTQPINPDEIMSASLRLYQVQLAGTPHGGRQKVELYQLSSPETEESSPSRTLLEMKPIDTYGEGWVNFDVTSVVRQWVRIPELNHGVEITLPCTDEENGRSRSSSSTDNKKLKIIFAGSAAYYRQHQPRGDDVEVPTVDSFAEHHPHLIIMVRVPQSQPESPHRRRKRSLDADYCFRRKPDEANCCLRELFIDFRNDLGWKWIHAPTGYYANFCAGACPYLWSMDSQHATILSLYKSMNPRASSSPCCTPKELDPLTIMYYDKGKYKLTQMTDMVLLSCKCS